MTRIVVVRVGASLARDDVVDVVDVVDDDDDAVVLPKMEESTRARRASCSSRWRWRAGVDRSGAARMRWRASAALLSAEVRGALKSCAAATAWSCGVRSSSGTLMPMARPAANRRASSFFVPCTTRVYYNRGFFFFSKNAHSQSPPQLPVDRIVIVPHSAINCQLLESRRCFRCFLFVFYHLR